MKAEASNQKIAWFQREQKAGTLDLSPEFQRNPVWIDEEASYLIDTILCGLPFPEIYLRSQTDAKGRISHEVVDGQQRVRAILRFGSNDLTLEGDEVGAKYQGKNFEDFSKKEKERFWNYNVVVRDLGEASNAEIRDLFRRLNKHSVVLNPQELRHARFRGSFLKLMEELADDPWWSDSRIVTPKQVRRMEDIEFVSELFVGIMAGPQNKKDSLNDYYENYEREFLDKAKWTQLFRDTKALIVDILSPEQIVEWSGKSDFYSLFLAMSNFATATFTRPQKNKIKAALSKFRESVDEAKKKDAKEISNRQLKNYVQAVTRAASDIDRRKVRLDIIKKIVNKAAPAGD
jgi:hypothetical protein